jgi:hypothetical protein
MPSTVTYTSGLRLIAILMGGLMLGLGLVVSMGVSE